MLEADRPLAFIEDLHLDLTAVLHAEQAFTYFAPVFVGDEVLLETSVSEIFEKKKGALVFIVQNTHVVKNGLVVADMRRTLVVRDTALQETPESEPVRAAVIPPTGELVASRLFPKINRHTLALYSGASGDDNPIHVDLDFARASGFPDVFAHGMLVMAYLGIILEEALPTEGLISFSARFVEVTQLGAEITGEARVVERNSETITLRLIAKDHNGRTKIEGAAVVDAKLWREPNGQA